MKNISFLQILTYVFNQQTMYSEILLLITGMKKYKLLIISIECIFFISCKEVHQDPLPANTKGCKEMVEINIDLDKNSLPYDSLIAFVKFVKLETTGNNLIGSISQILFSQNKIIIVDWEVSKSITVYDESGRFLNKIGALGQGPEEYVFLRHVALTPDKSMVVVLDMGSRSMKYYSIDGRFIKSEKTPFWFSHCEFITDNIVAGEYNGGNLLPGHNNQYKPQLVTTTLQKKVCNSGFQSYYSKNFAATTLMPLRKFEEEVFYSPPFSDTIFQVTQNRLQARYHLKIQGTTPFVIDENTTKKSWDEYINKNPFFNGDIIELKDAAIFHIFEPHLKWLRFAIYSKRKKQVFTCDGTLHSPFFYLFDAPKARYKENMIVIDTRATFILEGKHAFYQLGEKSLIDNLYHDLTEDSNPVLFFYKIKV